MALQIKQEQPFVQDICNDLCLPEMNVQFHGAHNMPIMHQQMPPQVAVRPTPGVVVHHGAPQQPHAPNAQPVTLTVSQKSANDERQIDSKSAKGAFGWTSIDDISIPCLMRDEKRFVAVRMVEMKLLSKYPSTYPEELKSKPPLMSHYVTSAEAKLLNEINTEHCAGEYGDQPFTSQDLIVRLADFQEFYKVVKKHFPNVIQNGQATLSQTPSPNAGPVVVDGGWLQINNTVVPFVIRGDHRMVPLSVVRYAAGLLTDVVVEGSNPSESECFYLNTICKAVGLNFHFAKTTRLISLDIISTASKTPVEIGELPKGDPFNHAEYRGLTQMAKEAIRSQQMPPVIRADFPNSRSPVFTRLPVNATPVTSGEQFLGTRQQWMNPHMNSYRPPPPYPGYAANRPQVQVSRFQNPTIAQYQQAVAGANSSHQPTLKASSVQTVSPQVPAKQVMAQSSVAHQPTVNVMTSNATTIPSSCLKGTNTSTDLQRAAVLALQQLHNLASEKGYIKDTLPKSIPTSIPQNVSNNTMSNSPVTSLNNVSANLGQQSHSPKSLSNCNQASTVPVQAQAVIAPQTSPAQVSLNVAAPLLLTGIGAVSSSMVSVVQTSVTQSVPVASQPGIFRSNSQARSAAMPAILPNIQLSGLLTGTQSATVPVAIPVQQLQAIVGQNLINQTLNTNVLLGQLATLPATVPIVAAGEKQPVLMPQGSSTFQVTSQNTSVVTAITHNPSVTTVAVQNQTPNVAAPLTQTAGNPVVETNVARGPQLPGVQITIQPVEFHGKTISCLKRKVGDALYALVEAIARVYFPKSSLEDFQLALEAVLRVPSYQLTAEEERAFIQFYGLPTNVLICNKVVKLAEIDQYMPELKRMFLQKEATQTGNTSAPPQQSGTSEGDVNVILKNSEQTTSLPTTTTVEALKKYINNKRPTTDDTTAPVAKATKMCSQNVDDVGNGSRLAEIDEITGSTSNTLPASNQQTVDVSHKLKVRTTDEGSVVICVEDE